MNRDREVEAAVDMLCERVRKQHRDAGWIDAKGNLTRAGQRRILGLAAS